MQRLPVRRTLAVSGLLVSLVAIVGWLPLSFPAAGSAVAPTSDAAAQKLIVHEWGTFTSFAGSDGVQLDFRPLLDSDLPAFVLNRQRQAGAVSLLAKSSLSAPLRMETPVTYFYTDQPRTVRVRVDFPQGLLTEFYPPVRSMQPAYSGGRPETLGPSQLDWGEITLIPESFLRPNLNDDELSAALGQLLMTTAPPHGDASGHYVAARETDSALVAVNLSPVSRDPGNAEQFLLTVPPPSGLHVEKFLFYRGVGKFELPLQAEFTSENLVSVKNLGDEPIRSLFLIDVNRPNELIIKRSHLPELGPKQTKSLTGPSEVITLNALYQEIQDALEQDGLYPKEAAAMVKTWSDSWFQEQGLRLFYIVPRSVTDRVLPLTVEPAADETVRVLVGRMELLPPDQESSLAEAVTRYRVAREKLLAEQQDPNSAPLPPEIQKLGRFAEPALSRVRELAHDDADAREANQLLRRLRSRE